MNVLSFTGNLGRDASTNNVSGTAVANFAVAMKSGYGQNEQTVWVDCALWGKRAEGGLVGYLKKGQQVAVTGELGTREYQKSDGSTGFSVTCRVSDVTLIGGKGESEPAPQQQPQSHNQETAASQPAPGQYGSPQPAPTAPPGDDEIPFSPMYGACGG